MVDYQEKFRNFWKTYNYIYEKQKEIYILSEEYDNDLSSFIQPIKEQKDSLDHIARAYKEYYDIENLQNENLIVDNLNKALGHIFRAYYDTVDFFSIILRQKISANLQNFTYSQIVSVWKDYEIYRKQLVNFPEKLAQLRLNKGIDKSNNEISVKIEKYQKIIYELFDIFKIFMLEIYPKLVKKFNL